jgi:hypothetical protein
MRDGLPFRVVEQVDPLRVRLPHRATLSPVLGRTTGGVSGRCRSIGIPPLGERPPLHSSSARRGATTTLPGWRTKARTPRRPSVRVGPRCCSSRGPCSSSVLRWTIRLAPLDEDLDLLLRSELSPQTRPHLLGTPGSPHPPGHRRRGASSGRWWRYRRYPSGVGRPCGPPAPVRLVASGADAVTHSQDRSDTGVDVTSETQNGER